MDSYFRGNSHEVQFCQKVRAGGNHLVATTAAGHRLGGNVHLRLREKELTAVLREYSKLSKADRKPQLEDPSQATPARRMTPKPPPNGLIVRGFCTYLHRDDDGKISRVKQFYYKENPDRWAAETQSDMLWLTEKEWRSLIPAQPKPGDEIEVAMPIQRRFFSTIGIDYMEGSVNSLVPRETSMTLTVEQVDANGVTMRLNGHARLGKEQSEKLRTKSRSRGCNIRVLGKLRYNVKKDAFDRFDLVGVGKAWGNMMDYTRREIRIQEYPWTYGIACELVTGSSPIDRIPPYNLLH
ncbi:MAG: hypothetical protein IH991_12615, partial [Planctomycetes bacterium]|nr:hypothetical protein [Planctomycetota bacterium]